MVYQAALILAVSFAGGLWVAWVLLNREFRGKRILGAVATAAIAVPAPIVAYFVLFRSMAAPGIVAAGIFSAASLIIRAGRTTLGSLDPVYAKAARTLGASEWRVFARIEFPLAWRPIAAVTAIALARVAAELFIVRRLQP